MKRFFSILRDIAFAIFVILICGIIFIMSTGKHFSVGGYQVLRVLTSSMEPVIAENTCIIIKEYPVEQLKVGDIITFTSDDPQIQGYYNTHRIHDIVEENGEILYVTKGDATSDIDAYPVHQDQVVGIYVKELPGGRTLGKFFLALSDNRVYFLVIMLPLALCLISYFWQIVGMVTGRYDEEEDELEEDEVGEDEKDEIAVDGDDELLENQVLFQEKDMTSDRAIEELLAEAAGKIGKTVEDTEKARIDRIVEELTSDLVGGEIIEKKREELKEEYKKIVSIKDDADL